MRTRPEKKSKRGASPYRAATVVWRDAWAESGWIQLPLEKDWCTPKPCVSVGFVVYEDDNTIVVANTVAPSEHSDDWQANGLMCIPKGWIDKIVRD